MQSMSSKRKSANSQLEEIILELKTPPESMPKGVKFKSKKVLMPVRYVLENMGLEKDLGNYRVHTIKGSKELSDSIGQLGGLIEPIHFDYNTKTDTWNFTDGRGRFWSAYQRGAEYITAEIFYDVPKESLDEISVNSNALKTKIPSEDIALFANRLYFLLEKYFKINSSQIEKLKVKNRKFDLVSQTGHVDTALVAKYIGRSESAVRDYLSFAKMSDYVIKKVLEHPEKNLYTRAVAISHAIPSASDQEDFFRYIIKKEEKDYVEAKKAFRGKKKFKGQKLIKKMPQAVFVKELKHRVKTLTTRGDFELHHGVTQYANGNGIIKELNSRINIAQRSIDSLIMLVRTSVEFKQKINSSRFYQYSCVQEYVKHLSMQLEEVISSSSKNIQDKIYFEVYKPKEKTFEEKIFEMATKRRNSGETPDSIVDAIGGEIHYIPVDKIKIPKKQLRRKYDVESIEKLSLSISKIDQRKTGMVREIGNGTYETIVGSTRFQGVVASGTPVYKTFIVNDLSETEIAVLQCMEDLHEQDSLMERVDALAKQYYKIKSTKKDPEKYTPEIFANEHKKLASKNTTLNAISFYGLSNPIKGLVKLNALTYRDAITLASINFELQLETAYTIMATHPSSEDLSKIVSRMIQTMQTHNLFDDNSISYDSMYKSIADNTNGAINYFNSVKEKIGKPVYADKTKKRFVHYSNEKIFNGYAKLLKSVKELESIIS